MICRIEKIVWRQSSDDSNLFIYNKFAPSAKLLHDKSKIDKKNSLEMLSLNDNNFPEFDTQNISNDFVNINR